MSSPEAAQITTRYRSYCDACQSGALSKLQTFWKLPALFTVDLGNDQVVQKVIETYDELEKLYSTEFGASTGVDQTVIDRSEVRFFGNNLATIETGLRHLKKGELHDVQTASYGCRKVEGEWWFISHISDVK